MLPKTCGTVELRGVPTPKAGGSYQLTSYSSGAAVYTNKHGFKLYYVEQHRVWAVSPKLGSSTQANYVLRSKQGMLEEATAARKEWYASDGQGGWVKVPAIQPVCKPKTVIQAEVHILPLSCKKKDIAQLAVLKKSLLHLLDDPKSTFVKALNAAGLKTIAASTKANEIVQNGCDIHLGLFTPAQLQKQPKISCKWSGGKIKVKHAFKGHNSYQCSHHHETNGRFVCSCRTWSTTEKTQYFVQYGKQQ